MKKTALFQPVPAIQLLSVLIPCKKDEYTIEDKAVSVKREFRNGSWMAPSSWPELATTARVSSQK